MNDLFARQASWATIRDPIDAARGESVLAMAYAAVYAARKGYQIPGIPVDEGLFTTMQAQTQVSLSFGSGVFLFLFEPSNSARQK